MRSRALSLRLECSRRVLHTLFADSFDSTAMHNDSNQRNPHRHRVQSGCGGNFLHPSSSLPLHIIYWLNSNACLTFSRLVLVESIQMQNRDDVCARRRWWTMPSLRTNKWKKRTSCFSSTLSCSSIFLIFSSFSFLFHPFRLVLVGASGVDVVCCMNKTCCANIVWVKSDK